MSGSRSSASLLFLMVSSYGMCKVYISWSVLTVCLRFIFHANVL